MISSNIAKLRREGRSPAQAEAIAYREAGKARRKTKRDVKRRVKRNRKRG